MMVSPEKAAIEPKESDEALVPGQTSALDIVAG